MAILFFVLFTRAGFSLGNTQRKKASSIRVVPLAALSIIGWCLNSRNDCERKTLNFVGAFVVERLTSQHNPRSCTSAAIYLSIELSFLHSLNRPILLRPLRFTQIGHRNEAFTLNVHRRGDCAGKSECSDVLAGTYNQIHPERHTTPTIANLSSTPNEQRRIARSCVCESVFPVRVDVNQFRWSYSCCAAYALVTSQRDLSIFWMQ